MESKKSIGTYLIQQLTKHNVHHVFGVAGDFVLGFNKLLEESEIEFINTCDEQGGGLQQTLTLACEDWGLFVLPIPLAV